MNRNLTPVPQGEAPACQLESVSHLQHRLRFELQPLLRAVELLANSIRVLRLVQAGAADIPGFRDDLKRMCPDWADPLALGECNSPDAVLWGLAQLAAETCHELAGFHAQGGAA